MSTPFSTTSSKAPLGSPGAFPFQAETRPVLVAQYDVRTLAFPRLWLTDVHPVDLIAWFFLTSSKFRSQFCQEPGSLFRFE